MTKHFRRIRRIAFDHHKAVVRGFHATHKHANRLLKKHKVVLHKVRQHSVKTVAAATLTTGMLVMPILMASSEQARAEIPIQDAEQVAQGTFSNADDAFMSMPSYGPSIEDADKMGLLKSRLDQAATGTGHNLSTQEETGVAQAIHDIFGITARSELEGVQLNHQRGIIAGEQHLPLYPGDTIGNHFSNRITGQVADPTANLTGMVPGLPSWGYFEPNAASVTKTDVDREQWGMVVQTFKSPGWNEHVNQYYNFYKYRKMIMINPETGQAVVGAIVDSGPSPSTGRSFGGSNEIIVALGLGKKRTGNIITLFVDDPGDTIPLGPLTGYHL